MAALAGPADSGGGPAGPERGKVGEVAGRPDGATAGAATGACVKVSVPSDGDPPESPGDGSSGASFETQNRPWQRGQLA